MANLVVTAKRGLYSLYCTKKSVPGGWLAIISVRRIPISHTVPHTDRTLMANKCLYTGRLLPIVRERVPY